MQELALKADRDNLNNFENNSKFSENLFKEL